MTKISYYLGGYNIIKLKPIDFGFLNGKISHTCSSCINFSIFDSWTQSWVKQNLDDNEKSQLKINDEKILEIQNWTDSKFQNLAKLFPNLDLANEFKNLFLKDIQDLEIYSINFSETDSNLLIEEFREGFHTNDYNYNNGDFILRNNLQKKISENHNEKVMGFDLIGVECDGSFHSFHCNDASEILNVKFGLKLNEFGLYDEISDTIELREFLKDEDHFEPVPYYICKVKKVIG